MLFFPHFESQSAAEIEKGGNSPGNNCNATHLRNISTKIWRETYPGNKDLLSTYHRKKTRLVARYTKKKIRTQSLRNENR